LGQVIRRHRQQRKITQDLVAPNVDVTPSALSRIESGQTPLTVVQLKQIAESLRLRASDLLREAEDLTAKIPKVSPGVKVVNERPKSGSEESVAGWFLGGAAIGALVATLIGNENQPARAKKRTRK
jgi:transcriptional regulator with XRE-family HTH domain